MQWAPYRLVSFNSITYSLNGELRRQGSQVRSEADAVGRQTHEGEAAQLPVNPVGAALAHPCASRHSCILRASLLKGEDRTQGQHFVRRDLFFQFKKIIEDFRNVAIAHTGIHGGLEIR